MHKTIRWQSCCSPDAPFTASAPAPLELTLVHISSHCITLHQCDGIWSWLWLASHLISFALQRFVSLLRFALEARAGNGFSLIESKCCSDRMEMAAEMALQRVGRRDGGLLASVRQTLRMCNISNSFGNSCQNRSVLKNGAR